MIGQIVTDEEGNPLDSGGKKLSESAYKPSPQVKKLFGEVQRDYQSAWLLQRKPFSEFDGYSLLDRARLDQETFGAFVGVEFQPHHKKWMFRGRKNTARNKVIGILAHILAGMLFPMVYAQNEEDEEDKMTERVMRILVEEHLRKAKYETKFMYFALSLLVNPASIAEVDYAIVTTRVKQRMSDGKMKVGEAVDEVLSGIGLYSVPIDELLLGDVYCGSGEIHGQPYIARVRRISYGTAKSIYKGKNIKDGKDQFDYVEAGKTRWMGGANGEVLFDVEDNESDANFVQELTMYYRSEDLQVTFIGGVFMGDESDIYNSNPFEHRRMVYQNGEWMSVPIYKFAMSGFEPIDPSGRFVYYKSASFKEYWEDNKINKVDRMVVNGITLDVIKPIFLSGVAKFDSKVMAPGATVTLPKDAKVEAYSIGPNLAAAYKAITDGERDMSESTQDKVMQGTTEPGVTATQSVIAQRQAQLFLGVASIGVAKLIREIGELVMDCEIQHTTIGELDASVPESLKMKYKTILAKGKEKGRDITNRIVFTDSLMGGNLTRKKARDREWQLYDKAGGEDSDQRIWEVNPYLFARTRYSMFIDASKMVSRSMGADKIEKDEAFNKLINPFVYPFVDPEQLAHDVIEDYSDGDPDRLKRKQGQEELLASLMGQAEPSAQGKPLPVKQPQQTYAR